MKSSGRLDADRWVPWNSVGAIITERELTAGIAFQNQGGNREVGGADLQRGGNGGGVIEKIKAVNGSENDLARQHRAITGR